MLLRKLQITNDFFSQNLKIHRSTGVMYIRGIKVKSNPAYISSNFRGNPQPVTDSELLIGSEGERQQGLIKLYTNTKFNLAENSEESDVLEYNNKFYKTIKSYDRSPTSGLYKVILVFLPNGLQ